jgi:hypothetical protein
LILVALEYLRAQGVDDSIAAIDAERHRIERVRGLASRATEKLEGSRRFHGKAKHTCRRTCRSSMNGISMKSSDSPRASQLAVACCEEPGDRNEILGRSGREGDPEDRVIVAPPGRSEDRGVQRLLDPGDLAAAGEMATGREPELELQVRAR